MMSKKDSTLSEGTSKAPVALKTQKVNLGTAGVFALVEGEPISDKISKKFFSSLKTEGLIK